MDHIVQRTEFLMSRQYITLNMNMLSYIFPYFIKYLAFVSTVFNQIMENHLSL